MTRKLTNSYSLLIFILCILTPGFLEYLLPIVFYKPPIHFGNGLTIVGHKLYYGFLVAFIWFMLAFLVSLCSFSLKAYKKNCCRPWSKTTIYWMIIIFTVVGTVANFLQRFVDVSGLNQLFYVLSLTSVVAIALVIFLLKNGSNLGAWQRVGWLVLALFNGLIILVISLLAGGILFTILSIIAVAFTVLVLKVRLRYIILTLILLIFLGATSQVLKQVLRTQWEHGRIISKYSFDHSKTLHSTQITHSSFTTLLNKKVKAYVENNKNYQQLRIPHTPQFEYFGYLIGQVAHRVNLLPQFSHVVDQTPTNVPFMLGETYKMLPVIFIPRLFWPAKPIDHWGNWYGHRYNLIRKSDQYTMAAMGVPIEAWINFGWLGIVMTAFFFGLLLAFFWRIFVGAEIGAGNLMLAVVIVLTAVDLEHHAYTLLGNLFHVLIVFWPLEVLIRYCDQRFINRRSG